MAPRLGRVSLTPPAALLDEAPLAPVDKAVVWFRVGDLRLRDHPGLSSAATSTTESVAPLFVVTPATPACVIPAVERLRADLRSRGSDLYVRFADTERQGLVDFVLRDHRCGRVLARRDVDARALDDVQWIQEQLLAQPAEVEFVFWREGLWHIPGDSLQHVPESYPEFLAWRSSATPAPPCVAADIAGLRVSAGRGDEAGVPAKHVRVGELAGVWSQREASARQSSVDAIEEAYVEDSARLGVPNVADVRRDADAESLVVRLLERLEAHEAVDVARALQPVLWLGLTSPRRIRDVCVKFERDRGRLWPPVYRLGAKTVLRYLDAREFADCSAERDLANEHVLVGEHRPKFYRWRGYLTRYVEAGDTPATRLKPAVVLVHGFGASAQHWNRPIALLAPNFHCFAFCNIGFGRAEKPPFVYTQHLWELFLASFVRDVVRRKSFVAGNSIGGYLAAAFACDAASDLCAGLALVNSAGTICSAEEFAERQEAERRQVETGVTVPEKRGLVATALRESRSLRFAACNLLLLYLRRGIGGTLRRVCTCPSRRERALLACAWIETDASDIPALDRPDRPGRLDR
jgi:pimeloyl-ACP methyl ester carboxylesterase